MTALNTDLTDGKKAVMTDPIEDEGQTTPRANGVLLQVTGLTVRTRTNVTLLSDISFHIEPGELIALTGLSRSGKSTLLQSLAGLLKPESGDILIDGIELYANLRAFRSSIGYVPAEFALQQNLTVSEVLKEAARLRLPGRASNQERQQRVLMLLDTVRLASAIDKRVGSLSRLERRRLSIAVELMGFPGLLLLDDPAEQLTPFEEVEITILLRDLARQGITIIQSDRRSRSAGLSDKVIFLAPGGSLAWLGPPDEAFIYLRNFVPGGIAKDLFGLREAIEVLANPQINQGIEWAKRYKANAAYQKYVDDPLHNRFPDLMLQTHPLLRLRLRNSSKEKVPPPLIPRASGLQKFMLLIARNFRLLWRDRTLISMLAIPPLIALVDFGLSSSATLTPERAPIIFSVLVFLALLTFALLVQNEIFKERAVYQREKRNSALLVPYILSKVWLVGILAIYQGLVWAIVHFLASGMAGGLASLVPYGITFFLIALIGGILGLMVSALARTTMTASGWLLLFTVPQLIVSGAIIPQASLNFLFKFLSTINPSRYAVEALLSSSGLGGTLTPMGHWSILVIMSLFLILILMGIQRGAASVRA